MMDMNPQLTTDEFHIVDRLLQLQFCHLQTKELGDGEIDRITRKGDGTGAFVYFHSNLHGRIKIDGEEFLEMLVHI